MPRRPNTRPTLIYWLLDIRPATIAAGWPFGEPFYCGKTIKQESQISYRLRQHFRAAEAYPTRQISVRLNQCGRDHVRMQIMEIVPTDGDWSARERHWIKTLRFSFPGSVNSTDGGEGAPGFLHSEELKTKLSLERKGRKLTPEQRKKISEGLKKIGPQIAARNRARKGSVSAETRAKIGTFHKGRAKPAEVRAKLAEAWKQRRLRPSPLTGRKLSPEHRAKVKESWERRKARNYC